MSSDSVQQKELLNLSDLGADDLEELGLDRDVFPLPSALEWEASRRCRSSLTGEHLFDRSLSEILRVSLSDLACFPLLSPSG